MAYDSIPGWSSFLPTYDEMVDAARDGDTIVEIGVAFGRSLAYLARKAIDSGKRIRVVGVDPWIDDRWEFPKDYPTECDRPSWGGEHAEWARALGGPFCAFITCMLQHAPKELERCIVLRCKSAEAARMIGPCRGVLIDGSHNYEDVVADIAIWRPHVVPGGILAGDDYHEGDFPGVVRAVKEQIPASGLEIKGTTWIHRM